MNLTFYAILLKLFFSLAFFGVLGLGVLFAHFLFTVGVFVSIEGLLAWFKYWRPTAQRVRC